MPYSEVVNDEQGNVMATKTWTDDGQYTVRDANGVITYQGAVPQGIVKAVGEVNKATEVASDRRSLAQLRTKVETNSGQVLNVGLNLGFLTVLAGRVTDLEKLVLAITDLEQSQ